MIMFRYFVLVVKKEFGKIKDGNFEVEKYQFKESLIHSKTEILNCTTALSLLDGKLKYYK